MFSNGFASSLSSDPQPLNPASFRDARAESQKRGRLLTGRLLQSTSKRQNFQQAVVFLHDKEKEKRAVVPERLQAPSTSSAIKTSQETDVSETTATQGPAAAEVVQGTRTPPT